MSAASSHEPRTLILLGTSSNKRFSEEVLVDHPPQTSNKKPKRLGDANGNIIEIIVPPGKLGVRIAKTRVGPPLTVVETVYDSSLMAAGQICAGDKLIAIDDQDLSGLSVAKVAKILYQTSANPSRKLTVIRCNY